MADRLYNNSRWQRCRLSYLAEHPICVMCRMPANVVDHVKPHKGDAGLFWDRDNWQALCARCHDSLKQTKEHHGYHQACGVDGVPVDKDHPWNKRGNNET